MKMSTKKITFFFVFQLILIAITTPSISSQYSNSITIEGYTYMNGVKIIPNQISLILPNEMRYATIFNDGKYQIKLVLLEQITGTFLVIYQNKNYYGGNIIFFEDSEYYENNIYITTGSGGNNTEPIADAGGPYYRTVDETVYFDGSLSIASDGIITTYKWDFGDGSTGSGVTPTHTYSSVGNYIVTLTVNDTGGNTDSDTTYAIIEQESNETINIPPVADAGGPYYELINEAIIFDGAQSYDSDGTIKEFIWDFGDGATGSGSTPTHTYSSVGNYIVTLTVTDNDNETDAQSTYAYITEDENETVNIRPVADAGGPYYEIITIPIEFDGSQSYDDDGTIIEYIWDFGDDATGNGEIVNHDYETVGKYNISLKVIDNNFDFDIDSTYAIITGSLNNPPTKPSITGASSVSIDILQNYSAESTDPDGDNIRYMLDWGDDSSIAQTAFVSNEALVQLSHSWKFPGVYQLTVYAEDENGVISDRTVKNILVDTRFCSNIGLLIDYTNDGIFDFFQSNITNNKTATLSYQNGYLIDTDGDYKWDYFFDTTTGSLALYSQDTQGFLGLETIPFSYIVVIAIIILIELVILSFFHSIRKKSQLKRGVYYTKERAVEKETKEVTVPEEKTESKDIGLEQIEKRIDELINKK